MNTLIVVIDPGWSTFVMKYQYIDQVVYMTMQASTHCFFRKYGPHKINVLFSLSLLDLCLHVSGIGIPVGMCPGYGAIALGF